MGDAIVEEIEGVEIDKDVVNKPVLIGSGIVMAIATALISVDLLTDNDKDD